MEKLKMSFENHTEILETPLKIIEEGPASVDYPGFFKTRFFLDGSRISDVEITGGYLKKDFEKKLSQTSWSALSLLGGKLSGESPIFLELGICLAIEKALEIEVSKRSSFIRVLSCELSRMSSHLRFLGILAKGLGQQSLFHFTSRDREMILDLLELNSGSRYGYGLIRAGGVATDITEGFIERTQALIEVMSFRLKEYNDLFTFNEIFIKRSRGLGALSKETVQKFNVTGPNARSVGIKKDIRKDIPYCEYDLFDFETPLGGFGELGVSDVHERVVLRLKEIAISLHIIRQALEDIPSGKINWVDLRKVKVTTQKQIDICIESPQGAMTIQIEATADQQTPKMFNLKTASLASFNLIPLLVKSECREDFPLIVASLDFCQAEVDL